MKNLFLFITSLLILSCESKPEKEKLISHSPENSVVTDSLPGQAKSLIKLNCAVCHNDKIAEDARVAPPLVAIKARYLTDAMNEKEFVDKVWNFLQKPSDEKAIMRGAVKRFGVMPYSSYNEEDIKTIARYMYQYKIEEPDWFQAHYKENHGESYVQKGKSIAASDAKESYADEGATMAISTKKMLGSNLMKQIKQNGTVAALAFCNERAYPITDSMSKVHHANIKRVSDKNRNPNNKANEEELTYINKFKQALLNNEKVTPIAVEKGDSIHFYMPIKTNSMCLQCHGKKEEQIKPETLDKIKTLYPNDLATGYGTDQVRGIWSISFAKEK